MITTKQVFYTRKEKQEIFPASQVLEDNYQKIKNEAIGVFKYIKGNVGKDYIQADDSFWEKWMTFPLRMFGKNITANMEMCPEVSKILNQNKDQIPTAFFSVMKPYKRLAAHYGPFKGILRYHLGLLIPKAGDCFISVDDIKYSWKEGEGVLFDETYLHYVHNDTPYNRIILFLDIKRPFRTSLMSSINNLILYFIGASPHNQKVVKRYSEQLLNQLACNL